ncbi:conserved phage C-terminal domain-containing protein [Lysinibacillus sp. JNUCC-52]|uniref:conserved phage C-terminal domain-containing protein n=1 Tax=Lysinibacillus sp. JNUCC-52 TaxID=2792480 RepID=UPI00193755CE|nr:conserved phage C-terminal domain-containing protein [Lysinibacillus sp. JNUCC-52]
MTIFRVQKKENYVVLDKGFLNDENLSWQAKGMLAYMLSLPNDWRFTIQDLTKRSKNGRDATNNIVKELTAAGYIQREQKRSDDGKFGKTELLVFETPDTLPFTEKALPDNPDTENPTLLNNKLLNNKINKYNVEQLDIVHEIITHLNKTAQKNFKATTAATKRLIHARLKDGYTLEHFKCVIDTKAKQWLHNPDMNKYLRPDTLFNATKFESYLNEKQSIPTNQTHLPESLDLDFSKGEDL